MNVNKIKEGSFIFTNSIFGERIYAVHSVKKFGKGVEVKTGYGTATFSILLGDNNWRFAVKSDLN